MGWHVVVVGRVHDFYNSFLLFLYLLESQTKSNRGAGVE